MGAGYGGGGVIHGSGITQAGPLGEGQRDYHYGMTPQVLLASRLIFGDRVSFDTTAPTPASPLHIRASGR
jgi:hypothetical protein